MKKLIIGFLLLVSLFFTCKPENFIFDLGFTTFKPDKLGCGLHLGIIDCINYLQHNTKEDLENTAFDILSLYGCQEGIEHELVRTNTGNAAPSLMVDTFKGNVSSQEISLYLENLVQELHELTYFKNEVEYRLVKNMLDLMFNPPILARIMKPIKKMERLIKQLAQERDEYGNLRHQLFILSNWDKESFNLLYKKNKKFFSYFKPENILISAEIKLVKPHKSIFNYLLTTYNLNPAECIFIDDQEENIQAAESCDICSIKYNYKEHKQFEKELQKVTQKNLYL